MIVLDTNVVSEVMRLDPDARVLDWVRGLDETPVLTVVTVAEIAYGIRRLPEGHKKQVLDSRWRDLRARWPLPALPFDEEAVLEWCGIVDGWQSQGHPISVFDAQIAAICVTQGLALATRNVRDFEGIEGLTVVDPWCPTRGA